MSLNRFGWTIANALICMLFLGLAPAGATEDVSTWSYIREKRAVGFGVETSKQDIWMECVGTEKARVVFPFTSEKADGFKEAQKVKLHLSKGKTRVEVEGRLESDWDDGQPPWNFVSIVPLEHDLFTLLKGDGTVQIKRPIDTLPLPLKGARKAIEDWQKACRVVSGEPAGTLRQAGPSCIPGNDNTQRQRCRMGTRSSPFLIGRAFIGL